VRPKLRDERLYWRGGVIWCRVPTPGSGRRKRESTHCTSEAAASARADELELRYADPTHAAAAATTIGSVAGALIDDMRRRKRAEATIEKADQKLGHFIRLWGESTSLAEVNAKLVLGYVDKRQSEGASNHTIKIELSHLGMALKLARHVGNFHLETEQVMPPFFTSGHRPRTRAPTLDEVRALLPHLEPRRAAHLAFILATGARLGEAERARRSDVDLVRGVVRIRGTKTEKSAGDVPITRLMAPMLAWALERAPGKDPLFHPWLKLHRDVAAACARAGIAKLTPNDLRRAFGKWHAQAGVSIQVTSKLLRHATDRLAQTTYANLGVNEVGNLVARALEGVPDLYPATVTTDENKLLPAHETAENKAPAGVVETPTNALGRRILNPREIAAKQAWMRRRSARAVPQVYPAEGAKNTEDPSCCDASGCEIGVHFVARSRSLRGVA